MSACIITIAGFDRGEGYKFASRQLYEMHKDSDCSFDDVWNLFTRKSSVDEYGISQLDEDEWKHHWSSKMSYDGQMLHATFFPRNVTEYAYSNLLWTQKPKIPNSDWPTTDTANNHLYGRIMEAEQRCMRSRVPLRGMRWSPLMSLVNCKVSPVAFLLLTSEGMTCRDCKLKRKFEQVGIKAIKTAQDEDALICLIW